MTIHFKQWQQNVMLKYILNKVSIINNIICIYIKKAKSIQTK